MVSEMARQQKEDRAAMRALERSQKAFLDSFRRGNGNGRR